MSMQCATSIKILNIRPCVSSISFHTTEKRYRNHRRSTLSIRNVYLMVKTHLSQGIFSEQDPVSPGSSSYFSRQDPRSTGSPKNCVDKIQDPLDPSTKCQPRIRQDSRSYILRILDPGYSLDLGTCLERSLDRIGPLIIEQNLPPRSGDP